LSINIKYTKEQEDELYNNYVCIVDDDHDERENVILRFMNKHDKSKSSVIAKLSKMRDENDKPIYKARPKLSKITNEVAETKSQMVAKVEINLGFLEGELEGLENSPKLVLVKLLKRLTTK
jgi:hypothetical protein